MYAVAALMTICVIILKQSCSIKKALAIEQSTFHLGHHDIGTLYNNIGRIYNHMGESYVAFTYHQEVLNILEKALTHLEKALQIKENACSSYHPNVSWHYNNIGKLRLLIYHPDLKLYRDNFRLLI